MTRRRALPLGNIKFPTGKRPLPNSPMFTVKFFVHSQVLQDVSVRVDLAFKAFFRRVKAGETPGFPRVKGDGYDSFCFPGTGYAVVSGGLRLSKITEPNSTIKIRLH
jgi:transposase